MGIMDNLLKNEEKLNSSSYEAVEKDKFLLNNYFGLNKDKQTFNMTVKFLAYDDVFPHIEGMLTRKIHNVIFDKMFKEAYGLDIKSLGSVADVKSHGFDTYNILEDVKWSFWNAYKATSDVKYKDLSNKIQESTESYVYVYIVDCSDAELIGKVFLYRTPIAAVKEGYIISQYSNFQIDVFSEDVYCRINAKGFGRETKWSAGTDASKQNKDIPFEQILAKNGLTVEDIKAQMREIDITRYEFNKETELEKMEDISNKIEDYLGELWPVVTTYSKSNLKSKASTVAINTAKDDVKNIQSDSVEFDDDEDSDLFEIF